MKQLIITGILSCFYISVSAQVISINEYGQTTDISGTAYIVSLTSPVNDQHMVDFVVNNESNVEQPWVVTRRVLSQPAGWDNYFCWGLLGMIGNCYDKVPDIWQHSMNVNVPVSGSGILSTYVSSPGAGCAEYRYYISTDSVNYVDSVDLRVCNSLGIENKSTERLTIAPNPAQSMVTFSGEEIGQGVLYLEDASGRLVYSSHVNLPSTMDVNALDNGMYFVRMELEGDRVLKHKLIIRH